MTSRRPSVVVLDYGSGNLRSAQRALQRAGADAEVSTDADAALRADGLVVPGVGAFAACMTGLQAAGGDQVIAKRLAGARPVLGICVGMQILFEAGQEHGETTARGRLLARRGAETDRSRPAAHGMERGHSPARLSPARRHRRERHVLLRALLRRDAGPAPAW